MRDVPPERSPARDESAAHRGGLGRSLRSLSPAAHVGAGRRGLIGPFPSRTPSALFDECSASRSWACGGGWRRKYGGFFRQGEQRRASARDLPPEEGKGCSRADLFG